MSKNNSTQRILHEIKTFTNEAPAGIRVIERPSMNLWIAEIDGPEESCWEKGTFKLEVKFPDNYPYSPPSVKFLSPIFHPNISSTGLICLDLLFQPGSAVKSTWLPTYTCCGVLIAIRSLLDDPNPAHGLNNEALEMFRNQPDTYKETVREKIKENCCVKKE